MDTVLGETETDATGTGAGALTVMDDVPALPSLLAVIVADPAATPVTNPEPETVATPVELLLHETERPERTLPFASRVTADNCTVAPTRTLEVLGETPTVATGIGAGALTVMDDVPVCPSLLAVIVADPAATPVTNPELETVATPVELLLHETARPVRTLPLASRVTADNCTVAPIKTPDELGETLTVATGIGAGALTVRADDALLPWLEALIIALPAPMAFTEPVVDTVATETFELSQVISSPDITFPLESLAVAMATAV